MASEYIINVVVENSSENTLRILRAYSFYVPITLIVRLA